MSENEHGFPLPEPPVQSGPQHTPLERLESAERCLNDHGTRDHFTAPDRGEVRAAAELVRTRALAVIAQELAALRTVLGDPQRTRSTLHLAGLETHDKAGSERGDGGLPRCGQRLPGRFHRACELPAGHRGKHHAG